MKYRNRIRAIEAALNFCTQNDVERFISIEKQFFTKEFLKGKIAYNKDEFLFYALKNCASDMVRYLISQGCELSQDRYVTLIYHTIPSKRLVKLYDILTEHNLMNYNIFKYMFSKLHSRQNYFDIEKIFIKYLGEFSYSILKSKLYEIGENINDKNRFFLRQLLLEEILDN